MRRIFATLLIFILFTTCLTGCDETEHVVDESIIVQTQGQTEENTTKKDKTVTDAAKEILNEKESDTLTESQTELTKTTVTEEQDVESTKTGSSKTEKPGQPKSGTKTTTEKETNVKSEMEKPTKSTNLNTQEQVQTNVQDEIQTRVKTQTQNTDKSNVLEPNMSSFSELAVGDYCEFGSYPQTEIVSQATDSGVYGKAWASENDYIIDAELYGTLQNLAESNWDENGDTIVDGNMYRRISSGDATSDKSGDANYYDWSSSGTYHYFKYEPIVWRVLEQNGSDVFLMAETVLDDQMYNTNITGTLTWESSTIRSWLNGYDGSANECSTDYSNNNFIDVAFSSAEQAKIKTTVVINSDSIKHGTEGGNDTNDKIFLLSEDEVYGTVATAYGFASDYKTDDVARQAESSTYAKAMGVYADSESGTLGNCDWWIRSPGSYPGLFNLIYCDGSVYRGGQHANSKTRGIRPALYVTLQ